MDRPYLQPYLEAASRHGAGFDSLLWASTDSQAARFDAICRLSNCEQMSVLDVGCGRADLLDYLINRNIFPADYVGIEAVDELATAAAAKQHADCKIIRGDFVADPLRMFVAADVVVFCGSLNTLQRTTFYETIQTAFQATADTLVFNFLSAPTLAARDYLCWHRPSDVLRFVSAFSSRIQMLDDYLDGDCTIAIRKEVE